MKTSRATETIRFDQGISMAEYNEQPFGQSKAKAEPPMLPGSTKARVSTERLCVRSWLVIPRF